MYSYGVDVGGTSIKFGKFQIPEGAMGSESVTMELLAKWEMKTRLENNGSEILKDIAGAITKDVVACGHTASEIAGIGVGVPGPVLTDGRVNKCVNLGWGVVNVQKELSELTGLNVVVENDANIAALGEMAAGAGRGRRNLFMITLGTGVGGGLVLGGRIIRGNNGASGEIGHLHVNDNEPDECSCGLHGCLEQYASAPGIVKNYERKLGKGGMTSLAGMTGLTSWDVFENAKKGNGKALAVIDDTARYLGIALANIADTVNPEVFVIGGGVSDAGDFLLDRVRENFRKYVFHAARNTEIVRAELGNEAGIYGAGFNAVLMRF